MGHGRIAAIGLALALTIGIGTSARAGDDDWWADIEDLFETMEQTEPAERAIEFNGRRLHPSELALVEQLEVQAGVRLPDGGYWYDRRSGAFGAWGGPTQTFLAPGLPLGGPMPENCSGGGTGVFINGRHLHPMDVAALRQIVPVYPGRYWLDPNGAVGLEGGPAIVNLVQEAQRYSYSHGGGGGGTGGGAHSWMGNYGYGGEDGNGFGYVHIPGTGGVTYGN